MSRIGFSRRLPSPGHPDTRVRWFGCLIVLGGLLAGGFTALGGPRVALAADPTQSSLYIDLDPQPGGYTITLPDDGDWHTRSTSATETITGLSVEGGKGFIVRDQHWSVTFLNTDGPAVAGAFDVPTPIEEVSCGPICAYVARSIPGSGDCAGAGPFTIHDIAFDDLGALELVDADFRMTCGTLLMSGSIRFHTDRPTVALDQSADRVYFPTTTVGDVAASRSVTFTNIGSAVAHLGTASLAGDASGDFEIATDDCSGATLAVGATCAVGLTFQPTAVGNRFAALSITDGTSRGGRLVYFGGAATQQSALTFQATSLPAFGPASATFALTLTPPAGDEAPLLFIDGAYQTAPIAATFESPSRRTFTYTVSVGPGHHVATAELVQSGWYLGAMAAPIEFDVGTTAWLELSTSTDDGVAAGEPVTLAATLRAGGPVSGGSIVIRDGTTDEVLASGPATGAVTTVTAQLPTASLGTHPYEAAFVPPSASVQAASDDYELVVVAGTRPETTMDAYLIYSTAQMTWSSFSSPDPGVTFQCRVDASDWFACASPTLFQANGPSHVIFARAVARNGLADRTPASRAWIIETSAPTATGPVVAGAVRSSTLTASGMATRVRWTGTDLVSGIDHYAAWLSTDGGTPKSVGSALTATTLVRSLAPGHSYRFAIRPYDRAGNIGALTYGRTFRLTAVSQSATSVKYAGTWAKRTSTLWWGGTARSSSTRGSTVRYTFTGRSIAWVGLVGPGRGKANVYVGGVLKATIDLYAAKTQARHIVWSASYTTTATRTVTIRVLGTPGRARVDVDGFVVGS